MGFGSETLGFIRKMVGKPERYAVPDVPAAANGVLGTGNSGGFGFDYLSSTGSGLSDYVRIEQDLIARYVDYEDQDDSPLIASALDVYADDAAQPDSEHSKSIWVESKDETVRKDLDDMLQKTLEADDHIWGQIRNLCKYGNDFAEIIARDGEGVVGLNFLPSPSMRRIQIPGEKNSLGFIHDPKGIFRISTQDFVNQLESRMKGIEAPTSNDMTPGGTAVFENWEVVHMRLRAKNLHSLYGYGIGEPARWIYKRLTLLEDSIILHRLTRAPSRFAFYIDVSNIPPNETFSYLNRVKQGLKKSKFVNPNTGKMDQKYNVLSSDDDFFLPMRDGRESTRVEPLQGPVYDQIEDVKFFENKLFAALKVPKPFLTYEESTAKTHLSAEDARFARTVMRIQREVKNSYKKVCRVHLAARRVNPNDIDFNIAMTIPSAIFELAQLEIRAAELDLADKFEAYAPREWIMSHVLKFTDEQIDEIERMRLQAQERGNGEDEGGRRGSGGSGALERALAKRGTPGGGGGMDDSGPGPSTPPPVAAQAAQPQTASRKMSSDQFLTSGIKKNTDRILERIEETRQKDRVFNSRWSRIEGLLNDLQSTMRTRK